MENIFIFLSEKLVHFITITFAEVFVSLFLIGSLFVIVGLYFIYSIIHPRFFGSGSVRGRVLGAVMHHLPVASKDDSEVVKTMDFLFPIFGYREADGTIKTVRGVHAGTHVLKYKTGQKVSLIIHKSDLGYKDTATDTGNLSPIYWGAFFIVIGIFMMVKYGLSLSLFSISLTTIIAIAISILVRTLFKYKAKKKKNELVLDFNKTRPIEYFVEKNKRVRVN